MVLKTEIQFSKVRTADILSSWVISRNVFCSVPAKVIKMFRWNCRTSKNNRVCVSALDSSPYSRK